MQALGGLVDAGALQRLVQSLAEAGRLDAVPLQPRSEPNASEPTNVDPTLAAQDLPNWLSEKPERQRGEFVLVLHDAPVSDSSGEGLRVLQLLLPELPLKTAVRLCADITGTPRNAVYQAALARRQQAGNAEG